ncbi:MAG TPA: threonylcarbamoyl-AMP synthase [Actinobacteria bacterium]|nr:threonylcarbamoyl-AMP synthase [Actinomycetota bacterium]
MKAKIVKVDKENPEPHVIERAAAILKAGGLVVFPTETVYGLGADAFNSKAVEKIFKVKGRAFNKPLSICISDVGSLNCLVKDPPNFTKEIIGEFWPGPLTLIFKKSDVVPMEVTCGKDTVGIRFPKNKIALSIISFCKNPVALTSTNISGAASLVQVEQVLNYIGEKIDLVLDGGKTEIGTESTILDLTVTPPVIIRKGAIAAKEIEKILGKTGVAGG